MNKRTVQPDDKFWYDKKGKFHRIDGPAVECVDGYRSWWVNGERHRLDGPAIVGLNNFQLWFIRDKELTQQQFERHPLVIFYRLCKELA
jgi:hypothetical protein